MTSTDSRTPTDARSFSRGFWTRTAVTLAVIGVGCLFLFVLPDYDYQWDRMVEGTRAQQWGMALWTTLWMSMAAMVLSLLLGVGAALARMSRRPAWNQLGAIYVEFIRSTPLLVQVMFGYFVVANIFARLVVRAGGPTALAGFIENHYVVGVTVLGTFAGAYVAEIVRASVESIDKGQTEAALAQGMSRAQVYRLVVFPQAVRRMLPPLAGQFVSLIKDSSLLMFIPEIVELTRQTSLIRARTYLDNEPLLIVLTLYFVLCFTLSRVARRLELRLTA